MIFTLNFHKFLHTMYTYMPNSIVKNCNDVCQVFRTLHHYTWGCRFFVDTLYSVPVQETAKHRAKFGWPPVSDVAAVTKARRETR